MSYLFLIQGKLSISSTSERSVEVAGNEATSKKSKHKEKSKEKNKVRKLPLNYYCCLELSYHIFCYFLKIILNAFEVVLMSQIFIKLIVILYS